MTPSVPFQRSVFRPLYLETHIMTTTQLTRETLISRCFDPRRPRESRNLARQIRKMTDEMVDELSHSYRRHLSACATAEIEPDPRWLLEAVGEALDGRDLPMPDSY